MPCEITEAIKRIENDYYDFAIVNIFHDLNLRDESTIKSREIATTLSPTAIDSSYWQGYLYAKVSHHFVNCDSPFEHVRQRSEAILTQEIDFAIHLGIQTVVLELPGVDMCPRIDNLARILNRYLEDSYVS